MIATSFTGFKKQDWKKAQKAVGKANSRSEKNSTNLRRSPACNSWHQHLLRSSSNHSLNWLHSNCGGCSVMAKISQRHCHWLHKLLKRNIPIRYYNQSRYSSSKHGVKTREIIVEPRNGNYDWPLVWMSFVSKVKDYCILLIVGNITNCYPFLSDKMTHPLFGERRCEKDSDAVKGITFCRPLIDLVLNDLSNKIQIRILYHCNGRSTNVVTEVVWNIIILYEISQNFFCFFFNVIKPRKL